VLHVAVNEPPLPICPIARSEIILIKWARNWSAQVLTFASCHVYFSSFLYVGERRLNLGLDHDAIDLEPIELSDREDGVDCSTRVPEGDSELIGPNQIIGQAGTGVLTRGVTDDAF
jgi:hypothetical protein